MTQLMGRPILGVPSELGTRSALADLLTGVRTALLTLAVVAVPVLGLWVIAPFGDDSAADAARVASALWLLGHGAPLTRGEAEAPLTMAPLLLTACSAVLLCRAGRRIGRRGRLHWRAPLALCAGYLLVAAGAVAQCAVPEAGLRARPLPDLAAVAVLAGLSVGYGVRSAGGRPGVIGGPGVVGGPGAAGSGRAGGAPRALDRLPAWARPPGAFPVAARAGLAWLLGAAAVGGTVLTVAVVLGQAGRSAHGLGSDPAAYLGMLLASAILLPNAVVWAAAYALGPGFTVGTGTVAAPLGTHLAAVPDFPLLALVAPDGGPDWRLLACALPFAAGVVPALLLGRAGVAPAVAATADDWPVDRNGAPHVVWTADGERADGGGREPEAAGWGAAGTAVAVLLAAVVAGVGAGVVAWAAGGTLGAGRMAELGPVAWQVAAATAAWFAVVAVPVALAARWWAMRSRATSWRDRLGRWTVRRTAPVRVALHRLLARASELRSPLARWRERRAAVDIDGEPDPLDG
ncbi:hypothetical protein GCM10010440_29530 [Kitasatospora cinereorecta]